LFFAKTNPTKRKQKATFSQMLVWYIISLQVKTNHII